MSTRMEVPNLPGFRLSNKGKVKRKQCFYVSKDGVMVEKEGKEAAPAPVDDATKRFTDTWNAEHGRTTAAATAAAKSAAGPRTDITPPAFVALDRQVRLCAL